MKNVLYPIESWDESDQKPRVEVFNNGFRLSYGDLPGQYYDVSVREGIFTPNEVALLARCINEFVGLAVKERERELDPSGYRKKIVSRAEDSKLWVKPSSGEN